MPLASCGAEERALVTGSSAYDSGVTRLLQDLTARQVYELPNYSGPAEHDILLIKMVEERCTCSVRCEHPNVQLGEPHRGNLMKIDDDVWKKRRTDILREMWSAFPDMSEADLMASVRNAYIEDAGMCFNRHGRPDDGCIDYKDDSKRIGSPSKHPWLAKKKPVYLCDFCPVKSTVQGKVFHKLGLYK